MVGRRERRCFPSENAYSSTAAAVPLPSQGKVKVATDYLFCIIIVLMVSDTESAKFTDY